MLLRAHLPEDYPSSSAPIPELEAAHCPDELLHWACAQLHEHFTPGEVVLFIWTEWLSQQPELLKDHSPALRALPVQQSHHSDHRAGAGGAPDWAQDAAAQAEGGGIDSACSSCLQEADDSGGRGAAAVAADDPKSSSRQRQPCTIVAGNHDGVPLELLQRMRPLIVSGEPYTERKSTFQAHVAPVGSPEEVEAVIAVLLESNKIRNAAHNMLAYRISAPQRNNAFLQDCDDDGEAAAGGRLLSLLVVADVRDVVVVVSRWFGGVLLGPSRFGLITNTARLLLERQGYIRRDRNRDGDAAAAAGKRRT